MGHRGHFGWVAFFVLCTGAGCGRGADVARLAAAVTSPEPFLESGGLVVMEAEHATAEAPGTGAAAPATWTARAVTGASGAVAMEATPSTLGVNTGDATIGPRRDYRVRFATPGTYQLWVLARGPTASDDTFHAGRDGALLTGGQSGFLVPYTATWINTVGTRRITVAVASPGLVTINVWMREDGIFVDKILLTTSAAFTPSGINQPESPREAAPPPVDAAPDVPADAPAPPADVAPPPADTAPPPADTAPPPADTAPPPVDTAPPPADAPSPPAAAFVESGGQVVMEAESSTGSAAGSGAAAGATWTSRSVAAASAGVALEATPNAGVHTADTIIGPRRDYRVRFSTAGTYQLWVRMRGPTASDDTVHAGLDGTAATLGESGLLAPGDWTWMNRVGIRRVTVTVGSPGLHTVNVWMREDGVFIDKVLLTTSASFTPTGTGPAESPREGGSPPDAGAPPDNPGQWSAPITWPIEGVHGHLLPNGKVLFLSYGDEGDMHVHVWDPATNVFTPAPPEHTNVGCSGHAFLPDGRLLVAGGEPHHDHSGAGIPQAHLFDYRDNSWFMLPDMNAARWYPNVTTLASGEMSVITGDVTTDVGNPIPQVLRADGTWRTLSTANRTLPSYSFTHLAPDGRVFVSGPERHSVYLNTSGTGAWSDIVASQTFTRIRTYGSSVLYDDGRILTLGGGNPPTATAEVIDLNQATPRWRVVAPMNFARRQLNATLLPDGRILVSGGTSGPGHNDISHAILPAEIWDPATERFTVVAPKQVGGLYHSLAMLLPDGRVLTTPGRSNASDPNEEQRTVQFYSPDYLLRGPRPAVSSVPATVGYASSFFVGTPDAARVARVTWIRLPSVTHAFDQNQRINRLGFSVGAGGINVTTPSSRNLCPPGHYVLFLLDGQGVPSVGRIIQIL